MERSGVGSTVVPLPFEFVFIARHVHYIGFEGVWY